MSRYYSPAYIVLCLAALLTLTSPGQMFSQEMPVPTSMQVLLFKKIFSYDKKLSNAAEINILISYTNSSTKLKDEILDAFKKAGISIVAKKPDQVAGSLNGISAIYIIDDTGPVKPLCRENKILSITGVPALVQKGDAAVGLDVSDNKPKILVHMEELKSVGHEFSAKLLQLAEVIQCRNFEICG